MLYYSITRGEDHSTISAFLTTGENVVVSDQHPNFDAIAQALTQGLADDAIRPLLNPGVAVGEALAEIDSRYVFEGGRILFDGERIHDALESSILERVKEGDRNWEAYAKFISNLSANPSFQSRLHLYEFIRSNGLQIDEDGDLVAYKGVRVDLTSVTAGPNVFVNGEAQGHTHIPNEIGSVISIDRGKVDDDRAKTCSYGLHVGAWGYASGFGARTLLVKVNPADVVSVPNDESDQKIRVCAYKVIEEVVSKAQGTTVDTEAITPLETCKDCGARFEAEEGIGFDIAAEGSGDWVCAACYDELDDAGELDVNGHRIPWPLPEPVVEDTEAISLEGLRSIQAVLDEVIASDVKAHDAILDVLRDEDDLGNSAAAKAINLVTEPLGFTTTRDSVRRWRSSNL